VESGDVEAAAQAIRELSENPTRVEELGRGARARAEEFAWEKVGEIMNAAYRDMMK